MRWTTAAAMTCSAPCSDPRPSREPVAPWLGTHSSRTPPRFRRRPDRHREPPSSAPGVSPGLTGRRVGGRESHGQICAPRRHSPESGDDGRLVEARVRCDGYASASRPCGCRVRRQTTVPDRDGAFGARRRRPERRAGCPDGRTVSSLTADPSATRPKANRPWVNCRRDPGAPTRPMTSGRARPGGFRTGVGSRFGRVSRRANAGRPRSTPWRQTTLSVRSV